MDAVYTWVDGNDPKHQAKRKAHAQEIFAAEVDKRAALPTRFADAGELWLSVRLLRQNAPWINTIYLVTDEQQPHWLNIQSAQELGITVVDHKDIFVGHENSLPTFNSQTIEALLWKIPNLSEQFIYLNDDFFVLRPVEIGDFFYFGKPTFRGEWVSRNWFIKKIKKIFNLKREGLVGKRAEIDLLNLKRYFSLAHAPYPLTKNMLKNSFSSEYELKEHLKHRYRHTRQIWPIGYAANVLFMSGEAQQGPDDWISIFPAEMTEHDLYQMAGKIKSSSFIRFLCVQSLDMAPAFSHTFLTDMLESFISREKSALGKS